MLAKLCVYAILSTMETTEMKNKREREDESEVSMSKVRKTSEQQQSVGAGVEVSQAKDQSSPIKDSLRTSLQELFKIFHQLVSIDEISPKVNFIFQFFTLLVEIEKSMKLKTILNLIPQNLITNLLKIIPKEDLTYGFVLR